MKAWVRARREAMNYELDFKDRGLENVKLQVLHANFAAEKDEAARRWIRRQDTFYQRITVYIANRWPVSLRRNLFEKMKAAPILSGFPPATIGGIIGHVRPSPDLLKCAHLACAVC
jgi:hypothetical protein